MALLSNPYTGDDDTLDYPDPAAADEAAMPDAWERLVKLERLANAAVSAAALERAYAGTNDKSPPKFKRGDAVRLTDVGGPLVGKSAIVASGPDGGWGYVVQLPSGETVRRHETELVAIPGAAGRTAPPASDLLAALDAANLRLWAQMQAEEALVGAW